MSSTTPAAPAAAAATGKARRRLFLGLALGSFAAALDQTVVATALPRITGDLGGLSSYTWLATAYLLTATAFTPLYGRLSDHFGRRAPYLVGLGLFLAGSLGATVAATMGQLIAARAVQGLGAAGLLTLALVVVGDELAPRDRARWQGLFGGIFAIASLVGPPIGGVLTDTIGWRWIFALNVPLAVGTAIVVGPVLSGVRRVDASVDYVGAALLVGSVSTLLLAIVWGGVERPWASPVILGLLGAGGLLLAASVVRARRVPAPILPLRLFRDRGFAVACAAGMCVGACLFGALFFVPLFLQVAQGRSASGAGRSLLVLTLALVLGAAVSGRVIARTGRLRDFPLAGTALITAGFLMLRHVATPSSHTAGLPVSLAAIGLGIGFVMQVLVLAAQNAAPADSLGAATSSAGFFRSIGGTLGTAALGALLANRMGSMSIPAARAPGVRAADALAGQSVEAFATAMRTVFLGAAAIGGLAFLLCLLLPTTRLRERSTAAPRDLALPGDIDERLDPQITNS